MHGRQGRHGRSTRWDRGWRRSAAAASCSSGSSSINQRQWHSTASASSPPLVGLPAKMQELIFVSGYAILRIYFYSFSYFSVPTFFFLKMTVNLEHKANMFSWASWYMKLFLFLLILLFHEQDLCSCVLYTMYHSVQRGVPCGTIFD